ncbi:MAG TPA: DAK2 domain-containing protein [Candidatus Limnocylindrales bacterium]
MARAEPVDRTKPAARDTGRDRARRGGGTCDGAGLLAAFRAAVANVEGHIEEINGLNVFPVPDGDTGSNMAATVAAALAEADAIGGPVTAERVAGAISFGALMGARGNSGVITSQIFRGMADGLGGKTRFNGLDLAHALSEGTRAAYGAVGKPVEGTILTVIREASDAAIVAAERDNDVEVVLAATVAAAERAVARTPGLLAILREAGVVDAGGQGLYRLFEGAHLHLAGGRSTKVPRGTSERDVVAWPAPLSTPTATYRPAAPLAAEDDGFGYETVFILQARPGETLDPAAVRAGLQPLGNSVIVAGDSRAMKVHIHGERPDLVIGFGLGVGSLSRISVENLDSQTDDVREARAAAFVEPAVGERGAATVPVRPPGGGGPGPTDGLTPSPGRVTGFEQAQASTSSLQTPPLAIVAVAAGEGIAAIFRDLGAAAVVQGGQSANPSTGELLAAIEALEARAVVILPNNPNVILASRQVARMAGRPVSIVPTRNAAEGFAALLALDPDADAAANEETMTAAARALQTLSVTAAVRDAKMGRRKVKRGQTIVLDPDDGLVAAGSDEDKVILEAVGRLRPGFELITVYYGDGADLAMAEALAKRIGTAVGSAEVEVVHGGQPHYRYLIAAE